MVPILDRRLIFVTGKGGVGKTTVASALAMLVAQQGRSALVCEVDAKGNLSDFLGVGSLSFEPTQVQRGLHAMAMDTEASLKEYLSLQLRLPLLTRIGPLAKTFDFVANAAPGVKEILTVGKLAWEVRERNYDVVIVDATASGHVVGQLASPVAIGELVHVGLVRQQTEWMIDLMTDPTTTGVVVVATPEEMPVVETIELIDRLRDETTIDVAGVVVNRMLPAVFGRPEQEVFDRLIGDEGQRAFRALGEGADAVLEAADLAERLRSARNVHVDRLRSDLPEGLPLVLLPYLFTRSHGVRTTRRVAEMLGEELT